MKVGIFTPGDNKVHQKALKAFAEGVAKVNEDVTIYSVDNYTPVDVAIVFGIGKQGVPCSYARGNVIRQQRLAGKDVIVIEKGFVKRDEYYMVGLNGLNNHAEFHNLACPADRWELLDVNLHPRRTEGQHIIVCGQVPSDASVQDIDIIQWCQKTCTDLRSMTDKPVVFRAHPLARSRTPDMLGVINSRNDTLMDDLYGAYACITYNSNAAVEAVIAGVPAFSFNAGSMAHNVTSHDLRMINNPFFPSESARKQWACDLAYTQWTLDEMRTGRPYLRLMSSGFSFSEVQNGD